MTLFCIADKTIKLWKISERDKRPEGYNLKEEDGRYRDAATITTLRVSHARLSTLYTQEHKTKYNYRVLKSGMIYKKKKFFA